MPQNDDATLYVVYALILVVFIIVLKMPKKKK